MSKICIMDEFFKNMPYYIAIIDKNLKIINVSYKVKNILGKDYTEKRIIDVNYYFNKYEMYNEYDKKITIDDLPIEYALSNKEIKKITVRIQSFYFTISCFQLTNDKGEVMGATIIFDNITDEYLDKMKVKLEREDYLSISTELKAKCEMIEILRSREKEHITYLKDIINNVSEGIIVLDSKGEFNFCNKSTFEITQVPFSEFVKYFNRKNKYRISNIESNNEYFEYVFTHYIKECIPIKNFVIGIKTKEDKKLKYLEINSTPIFDENKNLTYTIVNIKDITQIKIHELEAIDQAKFIEEVIDTVDVPIAVFDYPNFNYKLENKKYKEVFRNLSITKKENNDFENNYKDLSELIKIIGETNKEYTISPYEMLDSNGNQRFYKIKLKPYLALNNKSTRIHMHAIDITEEILHNKELENVNKLKDEFFTVISHELRTPLTIIYSSLQLATDIYKDEITLNMNKIFKRIEQNCSRLLKLTNNILDISKAEAGFLTLNNSTFDIVNVTEYIVELVDNFARSKDIDLIFDTNEEETNVILDKDKYEKILLNLLSNAIKFTPGKKQILVSLNITNSYFELSVKDQGVGIPESKINSIFDRFAQVNSSLSRRAEGTGLGLSLVKKLIELMKGNIIVKSKEGYGTEFVVRFNNNMNTVKETKNYAIIDEKMDYKINIEFSDIN